MKLFKELDEYLNREYSSNYWSDDAVLYAQELLQGFDASDWNQLLMHWRSKSPQWQHYCAEILPWGETDKAVSLLVEMVQTPDDELVVAAADSLRDIDDNITPIRVEPATKYRLREVARANPGVRAQVVNQLLQQLQTHS